MPIAITQVDAFTAEPFAGNPAAVCILDHLRADAWMQAVAMEMNLSETAFLCRAPSPEHPDDWQLRWFTPAAEVELCGHATLAAAHHLTEAGIVDPGPIRFHTASGLLTAEVGPDGWVTLDMPALPVEPTTPPGALLEAIGTEPVAVAKSRYDYLVELADAEAVRALEPDLLRLRSISSMRGLIVTAVGDGLFDIVSRFFAPGVGVDEDPVTGSAHCSLGPYWSDRLGTDELLAHQASARGGTVRVTTAGERVRLTGQAVTTLHGELTVEAPAG